MKEKLLKLMSALNVFKKVEQVLISKVIAKGVKAAVQALVGLLIAKDLVPKLTDAGVNIDFTKLESWLLVVATGLVGSLWNWLKKRYDFQ